MSKSSFSHYLLLGATIFVVLLFSWWIKHNYDFVEMTVTRAGMFGPLVIVGLYGILSLTPIPTDPLTFLSGALYGLELGILISWTGNNLAAYAEYFIVRDIQHLTNFNIKKTNAPNWLKKWPVGSMWFLICGRFVPGVGGKVVSVFAGIYRVPVFKLLWTAAVANLVGSVLYAAGGWSLIRLF